MAGFEVITEGGPDRLPRAVVAKFAADVKQHGNRTSRTFHPAPVFPDQRRLTVVDTSWPFGFARDRNLNPPCPLVC